MIKKHQNSSKEFLKKTFEATKENPNVEVNLSFNDKVIKAQPLVQPHGATHYCC